VSKFKVGDKVIAKENITAYGGTAIAKAGDIGEVLKVNAHLPFFGNNLLKVKFFDKEMITDGTELEKLEPENTETPEPEFKVGDRVKVKEDFDYQKRCILQDVRGLSGKVLSVYSDRYSSHCCVTFDTPEIKDWYIRFTELEKISEEKLENAEIPKNEKTLKRIAITLKNRQSAIVIIGNYVSADAEFVYYESHDGKTYEIREDEIIMIVSEDYQNGTEAG